MKKTAIIFLAALLTETGAASEDRFWAAELGVPCAEIPEIEKHLGSVGLEVPEDKDVLRYGRNRGSRTASIEYRCHNGRLSEQTLIVTGGSRDEAYRIAAEQKKRLVELVGEPIHDGLELSVWKRLYFGFVGADLDYLTAVVVWGREKEDSMLLVKEVGKKVWQVSVSRGSPKSEYIFNS